MGVGNTGSPVSHQICWRGRWMGMKDASERCVAESFAGF